jgi:hypothetical protein
VNSQAYTESAPTAPTATVPQPVCNISVHSNPCLIPFASFQSRTTTSSSVFGARQLQLGARFNF